MTDWLVDDQTTTRPSSHGEDGDSEGGWSSNPSDSQTTPKKLHIGLSDDRDRAAEVLVSETSGPVNSRTRSSKKRTDDGDDREASRGGGDDTNATEATGRGATVLLPSNPPWYTTVFLPVCFNSLVFCFNSLQHVHY